MGLDQSPVCTPKSTDRPKSIGRSSTLSKDLCHEDQVWAELLLYAEEIAHKLRQYQMYAYSVVLSVRDTDLTTKEYSAKIESGTQTGITIARYAMKLFKENGILPCRSVGLRVTRLREGIRAVQTDIFSTIEKDIKEQRIEEEISEICERFGKDILRRGVLLKKELPASHSFRK